jgi:hypothetical protein
MSTTPSNLPDTVTDTCWKKVREILQSRHRLSPSEATQAIKAYQAALAADGVGDEVYHAPVGDTARGISRGGYVDAPQTQGRKAASPVQKLPLGK